MPPRDLHDFVEQDKADDERDYPAGEDDQNRTNSAKLTREERGGDCDRNQRQRDE
jgi:hypothetical protein